ncbi:hypothetical protein M422DRAFT_103485, partial [Sphaerobolus stellatus SS14]
PTEIDFALDYGDAFTITSVIGLIVSGPVALVGIELDNQFFSAGSFTNSNVIFDGLTGILGVGFHVNSGLLQTLVRQERDPAANGSLVTDFINSQLPTQGPFLSRLVATGELEQPMFTITLQRDSVDIGGNVGQLTIGTLPDGVRNDSLTWVPVQRSSLDNAGVVGPSDSPDEVNIYESFWEVVIDDVILNGEVLPRPNITVPYTGHIDSGSTQLLGPQSVVNAIFSALSNDTANFNSTQGPRVDCNKFVQITYVAGGKQFPVDPRDFLGPQLLPNCSVEAVNPTTPPQPGIGFSWVLGDVFLKSNLVAFYYSNLTHPSVDPPRIGFLSTVPSNAAELYSSAISSTQATETLLVSSEVAPTGTFTAASTNSVGVGQADTSSGNRGGSLGD